MEKDLDLNQIREIIRQNHGELIYGDKGVDAETKNVYKIKTPWKFRFLCVMMNSLEREDCFIPWR